VFFQGTIRIVELFDELAESLIVELLSISSQLWMWRFYHESARLKKLFPSRTSLLPKKYDD